MAAGKAFRLRRNGDGEALHAPTHNLCRCCYRPLETPDATYCCERCHQAHKRLAGAPS